MSRHSTDQPRDSRGGKKKVSNRLVGLSAAAILSVYSAGYVRTRSAAEELERLETRRRAPSPAVAGIATTLQPPAPTPTLIEPAPTIPAAPAEQRAADPIDIQPGPDTPPQSSVQGAEPVDRAAGKNAASTMAPAAAKVAETPASAPAETPVVPPQALAESIPPVNAVDGPPASTAAANLTTSTDPALPSEAVPPAAAPVSASAPPAAGDPAPKSGDGALKDGTYLGWGTSRHGDIQASVVVENGRIAKATIAQCLTRYSCDIIEHLQKQVVDRQTPDVDIVGGATVSCDAFYWAVVSALKKAQ